MLTYPNFDPIVFSVGPLAVRWYGLMYLLAFAAFWWLGTRRIRAGLAPVSREQLDDLLFGGIVGVILGGRLGYVLFYKPGYYFSHPLEIFAVWQGGMSFHGGFLGVLLALRAGVTAPLRRLLEGIDAVGKGDLSRVLLAEREDDIGAWCSAAPATCRAIRRSSTRWHWKDSRYLRCCGGSPRGHGPGRRFPRCSSSVTVLPASSASSRASRTHSSACWRSVSAWANG